MGFKLSQRRYTSNFCTKLRIAILGSVIAHAICGWASGLEFNFLAPAGTPQIAIDGFVAAGQRWSDLITDDITVNISIAFDDIPSDSGATILGATGSSIFIPPAGTTVVPDFLKLKAALEADATSINDLTAVTNLPGGDSLSALTNARDGSTILDDGVTGNNTFFRVNTANAKALGFIDGDAPGEDASISFNNQINFDFDPGNGITPGFTDFVGVATHEIGHALGFTSGVDLVDTFTGSGPAAGADLNDVAVGTGTLEPFALFSTLDLFRRSDQSLALGPDILDLSTTPGSFFTIDGAESDLILETGSFNGSGQQASHFLDNMGFGILDPTAAPGELLQISENDLLALDVIGFDLATNEDANGFHNEMFPQDVNVDGLVTPLDAISVVNELNNRVLTDATTGAIIASNASTIFLDVNNDQFVTPIDALLVINELSAASATTLTAPLSTSVVPEVIPSKLVGLFALTILLRRRKSNRPEQ